MKEVEQKLREAKEIISEKINEKSDEDLITLSDRIDDLIHDFSVYSNKKYLELIKKVSVDDINSLGHGEEKEIDDEFTLYRYFEEDIFVIVRTENLEEVYQILIEENNNLIFEVL